MDYCRLVEHGLDQSV